MKKLLVLGTALVMLSACSSSSWMGSSNGVSTSQARAIEAQVRDRADYWQRADRVTAQHMAGPKAQHELHTDIASCVAQVRELVRLGSINSAQAPRTVPMDEDMRKGWDSVTRAGPNYPEFVPFHDFDSCMKTKGWDRTVFVKPVIANQAAHNYNATILGTTAGMSTPTTARYGTYGNDQRARSGFNN